MKAKGRTKASASQTQIIADDQNTTKAMEKLWEQTSPTTSSALKKFQPSIEQVDSAQQTLHQERHQTSQLHVIGSATTQQRLHATTQEAFNQLTLPLDVMNQGTGVESYMALPCKLKVNIKITPTDSKTKIDLDEKIGNDEKDDFPNILNEPSSSPSKSTA